MKDVCFTLRANRSLTRDIFELTLSGDASDFTAPGQFMNLSVDGCFLRRPISVCDLSDDRRTAVLICRAVGRGTRTLCSAAPGSRFSALTGLGNGFSVAACGKKPVLAGGGVGVPPLYLLAKELLRAGKNPVVCLGFASADDAFYEEEFAALGCEVLTATVDGSAGIRGFVTEAVRRTDADYAFCCGPEAMLRAVYELPQITGGQFSFEERMGCGFGACMGCSCKTKYGYKRICKDGPVLEKGEIVW